MALFLAQHGISEPKERDPARGLSPVGRQETELIAGVAKNYSIPVQQVFHSGKARAQQTADIFQEVLGVEKQAITLEGVNPLDDVKTFAGEVQLDGNVMLVGHLPFLEKLVSHLLCGDEEKRIYRFQNSGILCLDGEIGDDGEIDWYIKWALNPNVG